MNPIRSQRIFYHIYSHSVHINGAVIFQVNLRNTEAEYYTLKFTFTIYYDERLSAGNGARKKMPSLKCHQLKKEKKKILRTRNRFWFNLIEYRFHALKESIFFFFFNKCVVLCSVILYRSTRVDMPFTYTLYTYDFHVNREILKITSHTFLRIFIAAWPLHLIFRYFDIMESHIVVMGSPKSLQWLLTIFRIDSHRFIYLNFSFISFQVNDSINAPCILLNARREKWSFDKISEWNDNFNRIPNACGDSSDKHEFERTKKKINANRESKNGKWNACIRILLFIDFQIECMNRCT